MTDDVDKLVSESVLQKIKEYQKKNRSNNSSKLEKLREELSKQYGEIDLNRSLAKKMLSDFKKIVNDIFKNYGGGEICNSKENTCKKLMILYKLWEENKLQDKYLKKSLFKRFSPETIIHRFNKIFEE